MSDDRIMWVVTLLGSVVGWAMLYIRHERQEGVRQGEAKQARVQQHEATARLFKRLERMEYRLNVLYDHAIRDGSITPTSGGAAIPSID